MTDTLPLRHLNTVGKYLQFNRNVDLSESGFDSTKAAFVCRRWQKLESFQVLPDHRKRTNAHYLGRITKAPELKMWTAFYRELVKVSLNHRDQLFKQKYHCLDIKIQTALAYYFCVRKHELVLPLIYNDEICYSASIRDITTGKHDLRVPRLAALIDDVSHSPTGCWILRLKDATGIISSFISSETAAQYPDLTTKGAAVLLQKVGIFVSKERDLSSLKDGSSSSNLYKLYLNIHSRCVVAVFSNQSTSNSKKEDVKSIKDVSSASYLLDESEDVEYTYRKGDAESCGDQATYQKNYRESFEKVIMFSEEPPANEKKKVRRSVD